MLGEFNWSGKVPAALIALATISLAACMPTAPTPFPTPDLTSTPLVLPSLTDTATPSTTPTATETPTSTSTATPRQPIFILDTSSNCRAGPGVPYHVITTSRSESELPIIGQSSFFGPLWWLVRVDSAQCWIWSGLGKTAGPADDVDHVAPPPTPTPSPTPFRTPTPRPLVNPFPLTVVNGSGENLCFLFIVPANSTGWGLSVMPVNAYLPPDGRLTFVRSAGNYNLRAENCQDDVIDIETDLALNTARAWVVDEDS